jgi:hypothetical protein
VPPVLRCFLAFDSSRLLNMALRLSQGRGFPLAYGPESSGGG